MAKSAAKSWARQPSWWVVIISGGLVVVFFIAIIRELITSHLVSQQVANLRKQVAAQETQQHQLQDLIDYLGSPTFQEEQARLQLGLKKTGERVIVVPPQPGLGNDNSNTALGDTSGTGQAAGPPPSHASQWWSYFFRHSSSART